MKKRMIFAAIAALLLTLALSANALTLPPVIHLPAGSPPEGIASGKGSEFFVGNLLEGTIYKGDYKNNQVSEWIAGVPNDYAVGMKFDPRSGYLFVAGGPSGAGYVFDTKSRDRVATLQFGERNTFAAQNPASFINDVVVTRDAAYFTESFAARVYKVPLEANGRLPGPTHVQTLTLSVEWVQAPGAWAFNANGIEATPDGKTLILVNTSTGMLFKVDPATGEARLIDLGGGKVEQGDGILLDGKMLYVAQSYLNKVATIALNKDITKGLIVNVVERDDFSVPTTLAQFGSFLYAVNSHFYDTGGGGELFLEGTPHEVLQLSK